MIWTYVGGSVTHGCPHLMDVSRHPGGGKTYTVSVKGRMCRYGGAMMRNLVSSHLKEAGHSYGTLGKNINIALGSSIDMKVKGLPFHSVAHQHDY